MKNVLTMVHFCNGNTQYNKLHLQNLLYIYIIFSFLSFNDEEEAQLSTEHPRPANMEVKVKKEEKRKREKAHSAQPLCSDNASHFNSVSSYAKWLTRGGWRQEASALRHLREGSNIKKSPLTDATIAVAFIIALPPVSSHCVSFIVHA